MKNQTKESALTTQSFNSTHVGKKRVCNRLMSTKRNNPHGGPLLTMLADEARRRNITYAAMAAEVGCTYGYINQLTNGNRQVEQISREFVGGCARFLRVPPIVIKIAANQISPSDFHVPRESEEERINSAIRQLQFDSKVQDAVRVDISSMSLDGKRAFLALYAQTTSNDVFGVYQLPDILQKLKEVLDENVLSFKQKTNDIT
jgi:hypothetical protein